MVFKNSCKLFFANFSTMWKMLLYYLICIGISIGLLLPVFDPIKNAIIESGVLETAKEMFTEYNISANVFVLMENLYLVLVTLCEIITVLFTTNTFAIIYTFFILFILLPFLLQLSEIPTCEVIYGYMSSCTKYGFTSTFIKRMGTSSLVALMKTLMKAIIRVGVLVLVFFITKITQIGGWAYFLVPLLLVSMVSTSMAFEQLLLGGWVPSIVVFGFGPVAGFKKGLATFFKNVWRNISTFLMVALLCIFANYFFGTFAFVVTIPMSILLIKTTNMVAFFTSQGMRYYVDLDTIISPQKFEESDNFRKVIDIL